MDLSRIDPDELKEQQMDRGYYEEFMNGDLWQPCSDCDGHDACWDFGCAIKQGIIEDPNW